MEDNLFQGISILLVFIAIVGIFMYTPAIESDPVVYPTADDIALKVVDMLPQEDDSDSITLNEIKDEIFKEDNVEKIAEDLAIAEMSTRDFKKDLIKFLMRSESDLEDMDYKDVLEYNIREIEVDMDGEDATVEVEFKVWVANYGDTDEEESARVSVTFFIEDLDEDDDYEDAEVSDWSRFNLIKYYD